MPKPMIVPHWFPTAVATLPQGAVRIITHVLDIGSPVTLPDSRTAIAARVSYRDFERHGVAHSSIHGAIRTAARPGYLIRPLNVVSNTVATYFVPLTLGTPKTGARPPENGAPQPITTNEPTALPPKNSDTPENGLPPGEAFYAANLTPAQLADLAIAGAIDGLSHEIARFRYNLRRALAERPDDYALHMDLSNTITRLCRTQNAISRDRRRRRANPIDRTMDEIVTPAHLPITRDQLE